MNRDYQWPQKRGDPTVQFRSQQHTKKKNQSCKGEKKFTNNEDDFPEF